jgi:hypothetical protein
MNSLYGDEEDCVIFDSIVRVQEANLILHDKVDDPMNSSLTNVLSGYVVLPDSTVCPEKGKRFFEKLGLPEEAVIGKNGKSAGELYGLYLLSIY